MAFLRIVAVDKIEGFCLRLRLTDGTLVERDVEGLLRGPVFQSIRCDPAEFRRVRVEEGALTWPNGADLCPDVVIWGESPPNEARQPQHCLEFTHDATVQPATH